MAGVKATQLENKYFGAKNNISRIRKFLIPTDVSWKSSIPVSR